MKRPLERLLGLKILMITFSELWNYIITLTKSLLKYKSSVIDILDNKKTKFS